jgi:TonB-linked SusC/RagA family outer membrane protein
MKTISRKKCYGMMRYGQLFFRKALDNRHAYALVCLSLFLLLSTALLAQTAKTVTGVVTDEKGSPVPGVTVKVKETTTGVVTDGNGKYAIALSGTDPILVFTNIGFTMQEITVGDRRIVNVVLKTLATDLGQVVVVAYGTQKKTSTTASVSSLKMDEVKNAPVGNITNSITGRVSGVIAAQNSGEPGRDGAEIHIRGVGTNGNSAPLYVVDGVVRDFSKLDPNTIETITVLKDAAAVAPYGMAGANGVVLVTTKKGKIGKPTLSYSGYVAIQNPTVLVDMLNAYDYVRLRNIADVNSGQAPTFSAEQLAGYKKSVENAPDADYDKYPNANTMDAIRNRNVPITSHNVSVSGGATGVTYYVGLGYLSQGGMWAATNANRYNLVANIEMKPTSTTTVSLSLNGFNNVIKRPGVDPNAIFNNAQAWSPINALQYSNGLLANNNGKPSILPLLYTGARTSDETKVNTTLSIRQELPIKGLDARFAVSYDPTTYFQKNWNQPGPSTYNINTTLTPYVYTEVPNAGKASLSESNERWKEFTYQGFLNYQRNFGKHDISGLLVMEVRNTKYDRFSASRSNYELNIDELDLGSSDPEHMGNGGASSTTSQVGYIYRATYAYEGKYMVEASGRYDGHYYFAPGKKYGFFPAFSLGWRLSEEDFIKNNLTWVDNLKVRGSWGKSGNLAGGPFQYSSAMGVYGGAYVINGAVLQGAYERLESNPNITWEVATKTNVGVELTILKGLFGLEADYFSEVRNNMLVSPGNVVPTEYGIGLAQENAGIMKNHGIDLALRSYHTFGNGIRLDIGATFTYARNKVVETFESPVTRDNVNRSRTGRPLNSQFGLKALRLYQTADFDENNQLKGLPQPTFGAVAPGDIMYADINGDGKIDGNDETYIGYSILPQVIYGLNPRISYRNFDLSFLIQGATQSNVPMFRGELVWPFFTGANATQAVANDFWTPENPNARYPRLFGQGGNANNQQMSSWWMYDGSYIRLKQAELGYSFSPSLLKTLKMEQVRFYLSGQNLLSWSKLSDFIDPEMGQGGASEHTRGWYYPQQQVFSVGLNVTF